MTDFNMKAWRASMDWSQDQAAAALGVTTHTYQEWERGARYNGNTPIVLAKTVILACEALLNRKDKGL